MSVLAVAVEQTVPVNAVVVVVAPVGADPFPVPAATVSDVEPITPEAL
jgi:hypothetical protein